MSRQAAAIDPDQSPPSVVHHKMATLEARFFSGASTTTVWPRTYRSLQHSARLNCATGDLATEVAGARISTLVSEVKVSRYTEALALLLAVHGFSLHITKGNYT